MSGVELRKADPLLVTAVQSLVLLLHVLRIHIMYMYVCIYIYIDCKCIHTCQHICIYALTITVVIVVGF